MNTLKHREDGRTGDQQRAAVMLPGWKTLPFEDCIEQVKYTKKVQRKEFLNEGTFPIVSQEADFTNGYWNDENDVFRVTTPVVIFGDHTQVLKYVDFDFVLGADGVKIILPCKFLHPKFLYYQLQSVDFKLLGYARHYRLLKEMEISFPPLAEQQRIVAILDEAFEGIATARKHAEQNLQNAKALFESHLEAVFSQKGEGWVETKLGDVYDVWSSKRIMETDWTESGVPFYGGREIVQLAKYGTTVSNAFISEEKFQDYASKFDMPQKDDVLITARGTIGVGYVVNHGDKFYYKDGNIISMRAKVASNPYFLLYQFRSAMLQIQFENLNGTTVRHLSIEKAKELVLNLPDKSIQDFTMNYILNIENETNRLCDIYTQKIAALDALKKSLLHQAFSGEL
jgi:type I restriction enzyme S subunit